MGSLLGILKGIYFLDPFGGMGMSTEVLTSQLLLNLIISALLIGVIFQAAWGFLIGGTAFGKLKFLCYALNHQTVGK